MRPHTRKILKAAVALATAELYFCTALLTPADAFQVSSSTGFARAMTPAQISSATNAARVTLLSQAASAMSAASAGSVALRLVAGPVGWAALGVSAGLALAGYLYPAGDVQSIKQNAAQANGVPDQISVNGQIQPAGSELEGCMPLTYPCTQNLYIPNGMSYGACLTFSMSPSPPAGWQAQPRQARGAGDGSCWDHYQFTYNLSNGQHAGTKSPGQPTAQQIADYLGSLVSSNPLSIESHQQAVGTTNTAPTGTDATVDVAVSPAQAPSGVVPASSVPTGSAVLDPNAPAPTQTAQQDTQSSTSTTVTNPDGSQTQTDTASVSCEGGAHNQKSFGQVLQDHVSVWTASGLNGSLDLIKNLTWPTTFPTYALNSATWGNITFDFNAWSGVINALRTLVIAAAGFVAYRIIFVGGS